MKSSHQIIIESLAELNTQIIAKLVYWMEAGQEYLKN